MQKREKLVLVTGAGFSVKAGIPLQSTVLTDIIGFEPQVGNVGRGDFTRARERMQGFLNAVFFQRGQTTEIQKVDREKLGDLTLEDVYTILDKAIGRRDWLLYHDWKSLVEVRRSLDLCVLQYLTHCQETHNANEYVELADRLTAAYGDQWATITLNWDTVWDKALIRSLGPLGKVPDYGCRIPWLRREDYQPVQYPTENLGVKLFKLHGSFNWLACPRCRSLFVSEFDLGKLGFLDPFECPQCLQGRAGPHSPPLQPLFLTPTIMKTFENPSLNVIWDNSIGVLSQANHVAFLGYSFPLADHDLRYLLRKAMSPKAKISVVLHQTDKEDGLNKKLQALLPAARYKAFFGLDDSAFFYEGWEAFFDVLLDPKD